MVFGVSTFVDDAIDSAHLMKQVEDDFDPGDFLLDGQDMGIPHVRHDGFQHLPLSFVPARKELSKKENDKGFNIIAVRGECIVTSRELVEIDILQISKADVEKYKREGKILCDETLKEVL